ncbi:class I SAM-dependent methyltransferase [Patescibacteria group bacterium]|nr:class I SAM-dependent methyltransferase [Patescibacteria group bacterium]
MTKVYNSAQGYDLMAGDYDGKKGEKLAFLNSFEEGEFLAMIGGVNGKKVLDVGCGTGRLVGDLLREGAEVYGVDVSEKMVEAAQKKFGRAKFEVADACDLPFENESFDVVVAAFLIVHLKKPEDFFAEAYRVLRDGGVFVVSNINQKKAPLLKAGGSREKFYIDSHYHIPKHVLEKLENEFFKIEDEKFVYEGKAWVNQVIKARKV